MQYLWILPAFALQVAANPDVFAAWRPAGSADARGPCPMLNTLANHGFINRNGSDLTLPQLIATFNTTLNLDAGLTIFLFNQAITTTANPNTSTTFSLPDLRKHNILEHDGSLSRKDAYFGNNHVFDARTFEQTKAYFTSPIIDVQTAANARLARLMTSQAVNPTYAMSDLGADFGAGETAAYLMFFGDFIKADARRDLVEYFFEHEKLPTHLGWKRSATVGSLEVLIRMIGKVKDATGTSFPYPIPAKD